MTDIEFHKINSLVTELINENSTKELIDEYNTLFTNMYSKVQTETDQAMQEVVRQNQNRLRD